jgi:hypothetical protein
VQGRVERALELARLRNEPVALKHAVVDRSKCVRVGREGLVERVKRGRTIGLMAVGLQKRVVLRVGQRHAAAVVECNDRMLDVGVCQHRMDIVRDVAKPARQRQQMLAFFVEHMLLLVIRTLNGEPVHGEVRVPLHPRTDGRQRDTQQLWGEPRPRLGGLREENLHFLPPRVRGVIALILIVGQPGVVPDPVGQLPEIVAELERLQQTIGALRQRARHIPKACARIRRALLPIRSSSGRYRIDSR